MNIIYLYEKIIELVRAAIKNKNLIFTFDNRKYFENFFIYKSSMNVKNVKNFFNFGEYFFKILYKGIKNDFYFPTISFKNNIILEQYF